MEEVPIKVQHLEPWSYGFSHGEKLLRILTAHWLHCSPLLASHLILDTAALCILDYEYGHTAIKVWNEPLEKRGAPNAP